MSRPASARHFLYVRDRVEWRAWLQKNHATEPEVWLVYYKRSSGKPRIAYDDAVEEALCFGWIDSLIQRIDDDKYCQKYSPRRQQSNWTELNKRRAAKLIEEGAMTPAGLAKLTYLSDTSPASKPENKRALVVPRWIQVELTKNSKAWANFKALAPSYRQIYVRWLTDAKRPDTRARRVKEAIQRLERNEKLGMK